MWSFFFVAEMALTLLGVIFFTFFLLVTFLRVVLFRVVRFFEYLGILAFEWCGHVDSDVG